MRRIGPSPGGRYYYVHKKKLTYDQAQAVCKRKGGTLPTFDDRDEHLYYARKL